MVIGLLSGVNQLLRWLRAGDLVPLQLFLLLLLPLLQLRLIHCHELIVLIESTEEGKFSHGLSTLLFALLGCHSAVKPPSFASYTKIGVSFENAVLAIYKHCVA